MFETYYEEKSIGETTGLDGTANFILLLQPWLLYL
jgi:hypothetical protein